MDENLFSLKNRVVLVTGGAGYLGSAVCKSLLEYGASVIVADANAERADCVAREFGCGQSCCAMTVDLAREDSIRHLINRIRSEYQRLDILVNGVAPGPFPDPHVQTDYPDFIDRLARKVPLGRIGRASEVAGANVFLASDAASCVTGQILAVDGGWTAW